MLQSLLDYLHDNDLRVPSLRRVVVGGSACPQPLFDAFDRLGVELRQAWGMTEMSPLGTMGCGDRPAAGAEDRRRKQGRVPFGIDMRVVDESGRPLAHDGASPGFLQVRGANVVERYYRGEQPALTVDGYFDTGDIGTISADGVLHVTDRVKDVIKSGGEWISSIELEATALLHPSVAGAAALGAPDARWGERPVLLVQPKTGGSVDAEALREFLGKCVPKWWVPETIAFVDGFPMGATGKIDKQALRRRYLSGA